MNGWDKFAKKIISIAQKDIVKDLNENKDEFDEVTKNHLFDTGGPTSIVRVISEKEKYYRDIFYGFIEINDSLETLKDIPIYMKSFPFKSKRITKPRYLRYHIENYFNEVYILKERLIAYLNTIKRAYKSDEHYRKVHRIIEPMYEVVTKPLEGIINTRGAHVHESRFRSIDLSRLETLDLLVTNGTDELTSNLRGYYKISYKQVKQKWENQFNTNNEKIVELLSIYGDNLFIILFDTENDELIYPKDLTS